MGTQEIINRVYGKDTQDKLNQKLEFLPSFYTEDLIRNGEPHSELADVEYVFSTWGITIMSEKEIKTIFPSLKAVFYAAGSVQKFARPFLKCGVKVFSAWAANAVPVAEYTVAQIILANKGFFKSALLASVGNRESACREFANYKGNYGAKVGIIGAGMIGRLVIKKLKDYNLDVLVFDPFLPDEAAEELGVNKVSLEELFMECNVISNHLANNPQTQGMLHRKLFEKMLPYATFLNTGRGAQVVESELIECLKSRNDIMAILDVTCPEPPDKNSELYKLPNCILTPHIAGSSGEEVKRMAVYMLEEFENFESGKQLRYEVTEKMLETMA